MWVEMKRTMNLELVNCRTLRNPVECVLTGTSGRRLRRRVPLLLILRHLVAKISDLQQQLEAAQAQHQEAIQALGARIDAVETRLSSVEESATLTQQQLDEERAERKRQDHLIRHRLRHLVHCIRPFVPRYRTHSSWSERPWDHPHPDDMEEEELM